MQEDETNGTAVKDAIETGQPDAVTPVPVVSEAELTAQMNAAIKSGDFKQVAKIATEIAKFQKTKEQSELETRQALLVGLTEEVKSAIAKVIKPFYEAGKLDQADGIWYTMDFEEKLTTCKLMKSAVKARTGGSGGGGKKFDIGWKELLEKHGGVAYKDSGQTCQQVWDADSDKNKRFAVREFMLKLEGLK